MVSVGQWTGQEAKLLRAALRMTVESFSEHLGVSSATVAKWERRGPSITPLPESQAILDTALKQADERAQQCFQVATTPATTTTDAGPVTAPEAGGSLL